MPLKYKVTSKRPAGMAGDVPTRFYPVLTNRRTADLNMICSEISARTTLSTADVKATVESLIEVIPMLLMDGFNPRLDEFGTFSIHVSGKGRNTPDKVTVRDIEQVKMAFLPSKRIKTKLKAARFVKERS